MRDLFENRIITSTSFYSITIKRERHFFPLWFFYDFFCLPQKLNKSCRFMKHAGNATGNPSAPTLLLLTSNPSVLLLCRGAASVLTFVWICVYTFPWHLIHNWSDSNNVGLLQQSDSITAAAKNTPLSCFSQVRRGKKMKRFGANNLVAPLHFLCIWQFYPTPSAAWMIDRTLYLNASIWKSAAATRRDHPRVPRTQCKISAFAAPQSFSFFFMRPGRATPPIKMICTGHSEEFAWIVKFHR